MSGLGRLQRMERLRAEARTRHERRSMTTKQLDTAQGVAQLTQRGPEWWEVRIGPRFLGMIVRWPYHEFASWEPLLPLGAHEAGISLGRPRYPTIEEAVLGLATTYGRFWQVWPVTAGIES